ncbi:hypothetical protein [Pedobacter psychroterrae]|uniref:Uncharacterized protein n=1 Tax=Pedobacter psychroterrae TaxID=2530453 RepID=A0A4R0NI34_9SPHI|nr:hypothetical protein [Pedobacter psychroterrae]TCC98963.1 hypothetical protein EZ437_17660 [Pedobacter psychroterrae]
MNQKLLFVGLCSLILYSVELQGQVVSSNVKVTYTSDNNEQIIDNHPEYYIDSVLVKGNLIGAINPKDIISINIDKGNGSSKVFIKMSPSRKYSFITVKQLKEKYVSGQDSSILYLLDGKLVKDDQQMIDENYVSRINVVQPLSIPYLTRAEVCVVEITTLSEKKSR